jgi:quinol monooxygenase YgiN
VAELIIAGWMDYAEHRDEVLAHLQVVSRLSQNEPGCRTYAMSADALDPGRIRVFEWWNSAEALDAHLAAPHVLDFRTAIAGITRVGRDLNRFVLAGVDSL